MTATPRVVQASAPGEAWRGARRGARIMTHARPTPQRQVAMATR